MYLLSHRNFILSILLNKSRISKCVLLTKRVIWASFITDGMENVHARNAERKRPLGRPTHRCVNNIKTDFKEA
jgi:hypothetical protein